VLRSFQFLRRDFFLFFSFAAFCTSSAVSTVALSLSVLRFFPFLRHLTFSIFLFRPSGLSLRVFASRSLSATRFSRLLRRVAFSKFCFQSLATLFASRRTRAVPVALARRYRGEVRELRSLRTLFRRPRHSSADERADAPRATKNPRRRDRASRPRPPSLTRSLVPQVLVTPVLSARGFRRCVETAALDRFFARETAPPPKRA
jgi:hypothetical protein